MIFITKNFKKRLSVKLQCQRGFTAAETAAVLFFLCLVIGVIVILTISANGLQAKTRFADTAAFLAQGKMAETELNPGKMLNRSGIFDTEVPGFTWSVHAADREHPIVLFADREFKKVIVEISLNNELHYTLEKYIFIMR